MVGYLALLTAAAYRAPRQTGRLAKPRHRFAVLVPAHNEERLLPQLLTSLLKQDYPPDLYTVHVVADNCTDGTAGVARAMGAVVHERVDPERRGKGHALNWLLDRLWAGEERYDAVLVLDADSVASENLLAVMDARLARGEKVVQAACYVRDPEQSWQVSLRYVALALFNVLRPMGRVALGGSAGLKGNGMAFAAEIARRYRWSPSLVEDVELHTELVLNGERVFFAPDAKVWAELPRTLGNSRTQYVRWERGRLEVTRHYLPRLLGEAARRRSFVLLDSAMELLVPPFTILSGLSLAGLLAAQGLGSVRGTIVATLTVLGQAGYVLLGLALVGAPRRAFQALLYAPAFALWKVWLLARVVLGLDRQGWVRTQRNKG